MVGCLEYRPAEMGYGQSNEHDWSAISCDDGDEYTTCHNNQGAGTAYIQA